MKNFLEIVSKWRLEIIFSVCFIICLCLIALPFASLNWVVNDDTTNFIGEISFINALAGGNVTINGTDYALKNTSILMIFGLVAFILSEILVVLTMRNRPALWCGQGRCRAQDIVEDAFFRSPYSNHTARPDRYPGHGATRP